MAKARYKFPYKTQDGGEVREGVWLDRFGELVHVRNSIISQNDFEYSSQSTPNYIALRSYSKNLVLRLSNPRQACGFLHTLNPPLGPPPVLESFLMEIKAYLPTTRRKPQTISRQRAGTYHGDPEYMHSQERQRRVHEVAVDMRKQTAKAMEKYRKKYRRLG